MSTSKCATLKHTGRFGGSLSPNPRNFAQPSVQHQTPQQQNHQHIQLQQHHLQKPNNQQLELQTYQLQKFLPQQQHQGYNFSTVSHEYNQQYPASTLPYKKPGTGFTETSSILKKHREEVSELAKPQSSVFSIETIQSHRQFQSQSEPKGISIQQQPLPEIPQQRSAPQELNASNLASNNYPTNYRSLQRPVTTKQSYTSGTSQRHRDSRPAIPAKVNPPILPPKNRNQQTRAPQPLPSQRYNYHPQEHSTSTRGYERERTRDRDKGHGRSYDDSHQYRTSSKQYQPKQNFQTLPHHHHHPSTTFASTNTGTNKTNRKSETSKRGSRELLQQPFENYSATEL